MNLEHIIRKLYFEPMCITAAGHAALRSIVEKKLNGNFKSEDKDGDTDLFGEPLPALEIRGNVAYIPVIGPITQHASMIEKVCGISSVSQIRSWMNVAMATPGVDTLLFEFNSPGGTVTGVPELAQYIVEAGKKFKTIAYTDSLAASAGFWLFASANERYAAPTAELLSVGVYSYIEDVSEMYKNAGVSVDVFTSGDLKGIGIPGLKLTDVQKAYMNDEVVKIGTMFRGFIKSRLPAIKDEMMRGQTQMAFELLESGVVHGTADTIEDILHNNQ